MVIVYLILSITCWIIAAICNAIMDTLKFHYYNSIFNEKFGAMNGFWNEDAKDVIPYMIPYFKYKVNAWHLIKSAMIVLLALSNCFIFLAATYILNLHSEITSIIILLVLYGLAWNIPFNLFYNRILITKK